MCGIRSIIVCYLGLLLDQLLGILIQNDVVIRAAETHLTGQLFLFVQQVRIVHRCRVSTNIVFVYFLEFLFCHCRLKLGDVAPR